LIAALNLLSEAELAYKQARNKRLLVELTLIKLSYLSQAIEVVDGGTGIAKKKLVNEAKPVAFRALPIIEVKEIERGEGEEGIGKREEKQQAKLIIEQSVKAETITKQAPQSQTENYKPQTALGSLQKIRQKISEQSSNGNNAVKQLTEEELHKAWGQFKELLINAKKHSAVTNFNMAALKIVDDNSIEIVTGNNIQQKFIENERADLVNFLQTYFNNRQLVYSVVIEENESDTTPTEKTLTAKEQYLKLIEAYPLVKELKDRLKLTID
jgi:DNA polymerase III subunit gamma/tau